MAGPVFFRVHEREVQEFIEPGGEAYELLHNTLQSAGKHARRFAPVRTRKLRNNIYVSQVQRDGPYKGSGTVAANVKYAWFVHNGTTGPIRSKSGKKLKVHLGPRESGSVVFRKQVRGQAAQPFLKRGLDVAMAENVR